MFQVIRTRRIFESHGFPDVETIYYGIPDFYSPYPHHDTDFETVLPPVAEFVINQHGLQYDNYFLYPHRPTAEKGSYHILQLAKMFPNETFVFMVSNNPVQQHKDALNDLKKQSVDITECKICRTTTQ